MLRRFGFRHVLIGNGLPRRVFRGGVGLFEPDTPQYRWWLYLVIGGSCRSMQFTASTPFRSPMYRMRLSPATSLSSVAQQLTTGMGMAVGAFALRAASWLQGHQQLMAGDFGDAFLFMGSLTALSSLLFLRLERDAGQQASAGHEGGEGK